jgi:hypothetical protein
MGYHPCFFAKGLTQTSRSARNHALSKQYQNPKAPYTSKAFPILVEIDSSLPNLKNNFVLQGPCGLGTVS